MAVLVQGLVGLGDHVFIFDVGGHIHHFVGDDLVDDAALLVVGLVHLAVGRLDKAVLIDPGIGRQVGDQTDVGAFRGLDGAHTAVVAVVDVADFEACAVTAQAAGAQGRQAALVGQLGQRVVLVHELGQGRRTEELLDGRHHRPDVDQGLGGQGSLVLALEGHALADDALHAGEADAELVLQQLSNRADSSVAQMVDVVNRADAVAQAAQVVDGGEDVVLDDVLWNQILCALLDHLAQLLIGVAAVQNLAQNREANLLVDADLLQLLLGVAGDVVEDVDHAVGDDLDGAVADLEEDGIDAGALDLLRLGAGEHLVRLRHHLAGAAVDDRLSNHMAGDAGGDAQLLVVFIASYAGHIVSSCIKEQAVQMALGAVHCRRLARTQLAVNLQQRLLGVVGAVLFDGCHNARVVAEKFQNLSVAGQAQRADEGGYRQLSVFIDADKEDVVGVGFIFQPGAAVRDNGGGIQFLTGFVAGDAVVNTRGTHQLGNDNALRTVDDEGAAGGHDREISHEDILLLDLARLLVQKACAHTQRCCVGSVALLALLNAVFRRFVKTVVDKVKHQIALIVRNLRNIFKYFL